MELYNHDTLDKGFTINNYTVISSYIREEDQQSGYFREKELYIAANSNNDQVIFKLYKYHTFEMINELKIYLHLKTLPNYTDYTINLLDHFPHKSHYILVLEKGTSDLFDSLVKGYMTTLTDKLVCISIIYNIIDFLHTNNILHLDIKLENFITCANGTYKICDFESSVVLETGKDSYTDYQRASTLLNKDMDLLYEMGKCTYRKYNDEYCNVLCMFMILTEENIVDKFRSSKKLPRCINDIFGRYIYKQYKNRVGYVQLVDTINCMNTCVCTSN